jgi:hypothetical protein
MTPLERAIKLREWTRLAWDLGNMTQVFLLNKAADKAYEKLTPKEALAYRQWCFTPEILAELKALRFKFLGK